LLLIKKIGDWCFIFSFPMAWTIGSSPIPSGNYSSGPYDQVVGKLERGLTPTPQNRYREA